MKEHDGLLLACPEYNSSITPLLKNTIDWVFRPCEGEPSLAAFTGKIAGLLSASPGQLGGLRGLVHVRSILSNIGVLVIPSQVAVSRANDAFNESGPFRDAGKAKRIGGVVIRDVFMQTPGQADSISLRSAGGNMSVLRAAFTVVTVVSLVAGCSSISDLDSSLTWL